MVPRGKPADSRDSRKRRRAQTSSMGTQAGPAGRSRPVRPAAGAEEQLEEEAARASSTMSELSSNLSHEYNRERSRQALCPPTARRCLQNVLNYLDHLEAEDHQLEAAQARPAAARYLDRMLGRVDRILGGEVLGDMVESELEDLQVDDSFEEIRGRVEGLSDSSSESNLLTEYGDELSTQQQ